VDAPRLRRGPHQIRAISTRVPRSEQPGEPINSVGWSWK
jgi:hypothetical protein